MLGLTAHSLIAVVARAFYALQDTATPVAAALLAVVVNIVVANALVGPYGVAGLAGAIAIAAWLELLTLVVLLRRRLPGLGLGHVAVVMAKALAASAAGAVVAWLVYGALLGAWGEDPGSCCCWRGRRSPRSVAALSSSRPPPRCGSRSCGLSSGSWSTSSAERAAHDGQPARGRPGRDGRAAAPDAATWDAWVEANPRGSYLQLDGWARVKAVNGWSARRLLDAPGGAGAQVLLRRPGPLPWAFAYAPRGPVLATWDAPTVARFTALARDGLRGDARVSHLRVDPEVERGAGPDADGAVTAGARGRGLADRPAHPAGVHPRDRPRGRRGRPVGRPAQEVAPVRQQGPDGRRAGRGRGPGAPRRVLRDLPRDRGPGRVPHPREVRLPRHLGRLRTRRAAPVSCSRSSPTGRPPRRCSSSGPARGSWSRTAG